MSGRLKEQTMAFTGALQAGELVRQVAEGGQCSQQSARHSLDSLFRFDAESAEAVFGGLKGLRLGLTMTGELRESNRPDAQQAMRYATQMLRLSLVLRRDEPRQQTLGRELELIESARECAGDVLDPSIVSQLAELYLRQISTLPLRIEVRGNAANLKDSDKVALIRAILLAGIRSGFLWFQLGGRPWRLLFQRRKMFRIAAELAR